MNREVEMELTKIIDNIFHLNYPTKRELTSTFLRFQEHYESPQFRGIFFTLDEFKKWYITNSLEGKRTGKFTYYADWSGFNIPSYIMEPFYEGKFDPLSKRETDFLSLFEDKRDRRFYVIGTSGKKHESLNHELAHGLFYTNDEYKKTVLDIVAGINTKKKKELNDYLLTIGYCEEVLDDEIQAYLSEGLDSFEEEGFKTRGLIRASQKIRKVFEEYTEGIL